MSADGVRLIQLYFSHFAWTALNPHFSEIFNLSVKVKREKIKWLHETGDEVSSESLPAFALSKLTFLSSNDLPVVLPLSPVASRIASKTGFVVWFATEDSNKLVTIHKTQSSVFRSYV